MKKLILIIAALLIATFAVGIIASAESTLPSPVPAQSKDDFIGTWQLSGASLMGYLYFTAEELGSSADMVIGETTMTLSFDGDSGTSAWQLQDDGTLKYTDPDGSFGIFQLLDDGTISTDMEEEIEDTMVTLTLYFARVPQL